MKSEKVTVTGSNAFVKEKLEWMKNMSVDLNSIKTPKWLKAANDMHALLIKNEFISSEGRKYEWSAKLALCWQELLQSIEKGDADSYTKCYKEIMHVVMKHCPEWMVKENSDDEV